MIKCKWEIANEKPAVISTEAEEFLSQLEHHWLLEEKPGQKEAFLSNHFNNQNTSSKNNEEMYWYNNQSSSLFTARQDFESGGTSSDGHLFKSGLHTTHVVTKWMICRKEKYFSQFIIYVSGSKTIKRRWIEIPVFFWYWRWLLTYELLASLKIYQHWQYVLQILPAEKDTPVVSQRWTSAVRRNRQTENCLTLEQLAALHAR